VKNRYEQIIENVFFSHYKAGTASFEFERREIEQQARKLKIRLPKNLGDLIYSFRYRIALPESVRKTATRGKEWLILPSGRACYRFALCAKSDIHPNQMLSETKIPEATPGIISMYALDDEQALLAKVRYNRLIDIFTRVTCYSLQSHLRTFVSEVGQVETDEVYIGVDRGGVHYVFPVQAKGGKDRLSIVQVKQDVGVCRQKFPGLVCRPIGAQFAADKTIVLFEFVEEGEEVKIAAEKHYRLVSPDNLTTAELEKYRKTDEQ